MKRILVGLDSSARAPAVLAAASELAGLANAKLIIYRAVNVPPDMPHEALAVTDLRLEDLLMRNAYSQLEQLAKGVPPARVEKLLAELATPWDGICRAAHEQVVDLIVIGSHGYGKLDRILGTTAAKVVNHSDRNVLVVRTPL
jgi:universal stress protein F